MALKMRGAAAREPPPEEVLAEHQGAGSRWRNVHKYALWLHLVGIKNHLGVDVRRTARAHARV
jgi:hypothetical protein